MESVNKKLIIFAIFMACVTTFLVYFYIKGSSTKPQAKVERFSVFVASKDIPAKHKILETDITEERIAKEYINSKAVVTKSDILGSIAKDEIIEGEQILKDRLVESDKSTLVYSVPEGKRAVSININDQIAVSNMIRPGDYVDVIANFEKDEVEDGSLRIVYPRMTITTIQNLMILSFGQEQNIDESKKPESPKTVTLAVTPQEAEKLVYVSEFASFRLALRSVGDNSTYKTQGITRTDLTSDRNSKIVNNTSNSSINTSDINNNNNYDTNSSNYSSENTGKPGNQEIKKADKQR